MSQPERTENPIFEEGERRAHELLHACASERGFLASPTDRYNYRRVWGRDGSILVLAALVSADDALVATARRTLEMLAEHQGPHGEIPSNVDCDSGRVSYGGTAGRVDAGLWFVVACGELWRATGDDGFLERLRPALDRVRFLLGAWQFNARGLLYVPLTGDWADEYVEEGYVLYDQLLHLQALRVFAAIEAGGDGATGELDETIERLQRLLRANYWFGGEEPDPADVYHEVLYEKGRKAAGRRVCHYWMPSFAPSGYSYRFDAFANVLASLFDVADDGQRRTVDAHIREDLVHDELPLLPAFHPVIEPRDEDWSELQRMFSNTFKNRPYEFQNGGLWPMITGFYVVDLARRGEKVAARRHLEAVHRANALPMDGDDWSFPEFVHGRELAAGGTRLQGWSAAAAILGAAACRGETVLRIGA